MINQRQGEHGLCLASMAPARPQLTNSVPHPNNIELSIRDCSLYECQLCLKLRIDWLAHQGMA